MNNVDSLSWKFIYPRAIKAKEILGKYNFIVSNVIGSYIYCKLYYHKV